jgi:uroporphyrinogen decarboxylase
MMFSRDRILTALNHQEPDRVPVDLNGTCCTALTRNAYEGLREYLGLAADPCPPISSRVMMSVRAKEDLLLHYGIDTRTIALRGPLESGARDLPDGSFYDEYGIRWQPASYYHDAVERPLAGVALEDLDKAQWPDPYDKGRIAGLREEARQLYENTSYCIVADTAASGPFEGGCLLRGYEQFCMDLYLDPRYAETLLDKLTETMIAFWDVMLSEIGDYVQVISMGDDVAIQNGPFISPEMYRKFIKPCHKRIFDFAHSKTSAKIFYHSCGSVYDLIPDFIEEGIDILNPLQRSAAKMDIATLKREFGQDLCFWGGGIDIQKQLPYFNLEQIEDEVKRTLDIMAPGGGFVFFPTHNIQADVSPDRIDRMFRAVARYEASQS